MLPSFLETAIITSLVHIFILPSGNRLEQEEVKNLCDCGVSMEIVEKFMEIVDEFSMQHV